MNEHDVFKSVVEFMVMTVFVKAIVAHWIAQQLIKLWKKMVGSTARNTAIWSHFQNRAKGNGHQSDNVLGCRDEGCQIFA